jgi:hypothetical protein
MTTNLDAREHTAACIVLNGRLPQLKDRRNLSRCEQLVEYGPSSDRYVRSDSIRHAGSVVSLPL